MGSPISCLLAELVLQQLEEEVMRTFRPKLWFRYVDATVVIIKPSEVEQLHQNLNSVFQAIQFNREEETGSILPFLDEGEEEEEEEEEDFQTDQCWNFERIADLGAEPPDPLTGVHLMLSPCDAGQGGLLKIYVHNESRAGGDNTWISG
ncbi:unnamed protein product [Schistocephalus solidus]|uniref:Reverse transcriptase domain-containing protein n=1 Tax=Schistocephalus solidus TaxID=70667 RepID=A0A183T1A8_SCHSO|nr:unnamed protein product [Schistocephalus solidus]